MYTEIIMTDSAKLNITTITDSGIKNNNSSTKQTLLNCTYLQKPGIVLSKNLVMVLTNKFDDKFIRLFIVHTVSVRLTSRYF